MTDKKVNVNTLQYMENLMKFDALKDFLASVNAKRLRILIMVKELNIENVDVNNIKNDNHHLYLLRNKYDSSSIEDLHLNYDNYIAELKVFWERYKPIQKSLETIRDTIGKCND